ncbi:hypothetical protein HN51_005012 [Arachis hypogaea]|uniref:laccase-7 n=1 Tax=Arachis hypogaea TaxID=3818 RepID=UPI000DEC6C42|nr:laccase-7 [Arachis hypogaea]
MKLLVFPVLAWSFALLASSLASAAIVEHTFNIENKIVKRMCHEQVIVAANGLYPGPTIHVTEGDTVIIHVLNNSPYNITLHWHGIYQLFTSWADGVEYVTQCGIHPGHKFTYKYKVIGQEGTLFWHAHSFALRATLHGAFIIHPRNGRYPFPKPYHQVPIILGDWYDTNFLDALEGALVSGGVAVSNAYTINGFPGDLFNCSQNETFKMKVKHGKTYLLRIINAALNNNLFFKIADHKLTVVAADASYTKPYVTDIIILAAGQTLDVLFKADQPTGSYYMVASPYGVGMPPPLFDRTMTRGIVVYDGHNTRASPPVMPLLPPFFDTPTSFKLFSNLSSLVGGPHWVPVPLNVDEQMFITVGIGLEKCPVNAKCVGPLNQKFSANMNNESFMLPKGKGNSMLEASYYNVSGVYTTDFPDNPPMVFDYTNTNLTFNMSLVYSPKSTKVKKFKFNSTVEIVFQNTGVLKAQSHPIHVHGHSFHVLAQGFGNYDADRDKAKFNLVNPQFRNTVAVPAGGWAVIRFQASNPGVWFVHCHVDDHQVWGLGTAFVVENGPTPETSLPPPPADLPKC